MAFGAQKIFPIDQKPSTGVGVGLPFNSPSVFSSTYTTKDAVRNNLINFFLTNQEERYLNPTFGGGLRQFIFEQIESDTVEGIEDYIQTEISQNFPTVKVENLDILRNADNNALIIEIYYKIENTNITDTIQLQFN